MKTFAKGKEALATSATLPQHSQFTMPNTLLGGHYGVQTSVQETTARHAAVRRLPAVRHRSSTSRTPSPHELAVLADELLHVHGHAAEPTGVPKFYDPTGLYHDGVLVPMCATSPLGPNTHICLTGFLVTKKNGIIATGKADQNGRIGFG